MTTSSLPHSLRRGFSLFEVLMVVAVIGVIAGIAIPLLPNREGAEMARDQRNAQAIVTIFATAQAAGLDLEQSTLPLTIRNVVKGGRPSSGPFKDQHFGLSKLSANEMDGAERFLTLEAGQLIYLAKGGKNQLVKERAGDPPVSSTPVVDSNPLVVTPRPGRALPTDQQPTTIKAPAPLISPRMPSPPGKPSAAQGNRVRARI